MLLCTVCDLSGKMVYSKMGVYQEQGEREQPWRHSIPPSLVDCNTRVRLSETIANNPDISS